jgi:hypothetical protein
MVKDFGSTEFTTSTEFMTNADVPVLATKDLIENPKNPFTGKPINSDEKTAHDQYIIASDKWDITENNGNTFMPSMWLSVKDNIWEKENWNVYKQSTVLKEIEKKHPMPLKPKKPFVLSKFTKDGEETQAMDVGKFAIQNAIFEYIEEHGSVTYQQIKTGCNAVAGLTDSWIHPLITALLGEYSIKSSGGKYVVNYSENPDWEVRLISEEDMRAYEEYQREEEAKKEKANQEKNEQRNKILEVMKGKGPVTVNDIREYSPEFDTPRTSMIMNQLAEEGVITKTVQSRRSYFEYK